MVRFSAESCFSFIPLAVESQTKRLGGLHHGSREPLTWMLRGLHAVLFVYVFKDSTARIRNIRLYFFSAREATAGCWKPVCRRLPRMSYTRQSWCRKNLLLQKFFDALEQRILFARRKSDAFSHEEQWNPSAQVSTSLTDKLASQVNRG